MDHQHHGPPGIGLIMQVVNWLNEMVQMLLRCINLLLHFDHGHVKHLLCEFLGQARCIDLTLVWASVMEEILASSWWQLLVLHKVRRCFMR